jgi:hypothetical protein
MKGGGGGREEVGDERKEEGMKDLGRCLLHNLVLQQETEFLLTENQILERKQKQKR